MNIFLVDANPDKCAQALCDLRLNKMILETAQLLCTAFRHYYPEMVEEDIIYKVTHENHPCAIWLRKDINNYYWVLNYFEALHEEKLARTGREHLSYMKLYNMLYYASKAGSRYTQYPRPDFNFNCSGVYPSSGCVFNDYKLCLINKWLQDNREPKWTYRGPPDFLMYDLKTERYNIQQVSPPQAVIMQRKILVNHPLWSSANAQQA